MIDDANIAQPTPARRASLWLVTASMLLIIGLKSYAPPVAGIPWHAFGWPLLAVGVVLARWSGPVNWFRSTLLFAWLIGVLFFTRIDGDTSNIHVIELVITLGLGGLVLPALVARYWMREPLDYSWFRGRWSLRMWVWLPVGFVLAFGFMWLYFNVLTPTLHTSWPLPLGEEGRSEAMWRLFWGCNLVGVWDELAFINFVFVLIHRHFKFIEANVAQAVFFTSFLHEMAFVGWGPVVIFAFALIQGLTYKRTGSLFYIVVLHLMIDSILFYMIANRWYPGWGWHPW